MAPHHTTMEWSLNFKAENSEICCKIFSKIVKKMNFILMESVGKLLLISNKFKINYQKMNCNLFSLINGYNLINK